MEIYEKLWNDAVVAFKRGELQIDQHLLDKSNDRRRGVTIVLRPAPAVRDKIKIYLDQLATVCPGQYFYRPEELHVTVLSIISGTISWRNEIRQLASYQAIIDEVLSRQHSFKISFRGITASPGSVMIQGFPGDDGLAKIRSDLRSAFARNGFGDVLDRRYKINTAHITAMRFRESDVDWKRVMPLLNEGRQTDFGEMENAHLQLIWGDWYASANIVRTLQEYHLAI